MSELIQRLERIELMLGFAKPVLTAKEAAAYCGLSVNYLHRLTSGKKIPFFKANGGFLYFKRSELDDWMTRNRIAPDYELTAQAETFVRNNSKRTKAVRGA